MLFQLSVFEPVLMFTPKSFWKRFPNNSLNFVRYLMKKTHPNSFQFAISFCNFRFACEMYLTRHLEYHTAKTFICDTCGKSEPTIHALKKHKSKVHTPKVPGQCTYCGKWYSSQWTVRRHILNMHVRADEDHSCEICGFVSSTREAKKKHMNFKHNPEKRHKCSMCEKAFKTPTLLKVC